VQGNLTAKKPGTAPAPAVDLEAEKAKAEALKYNK